MTRVLSGSQSEHSYSRAELKAIKKFNNLFKKIVVLPSNKTFSEIESVTTQRKYTRTSISREDFSQTSFSFPSKSCYDLGHNSKENQKAEENETCTRVKDEYYLHQAMLLKELTYKQNPSKYKIEGIQQLFYSSMKQTNEGKISDNRICRIINPILFSPKNNIQNGENSSNEEIDNHERKEKLKSTSSIESVVANSGRCGTPHINFRKNKERKIEKFQEVSVKDTVVSLDKIFLSRNANNNRNFQKRSTLLNIHKNETNVQINSEPSSTSLITFRCNEESFADLRMTINKVILFLEDVADTQKNVGCDLIESIRNTCEEILDKCQNCKNGEKKITRLSNRNGMEQALEHTCRKKMETDDEYEHESDRGKRIQLLIEKMRKKMSLQCAERLQISGIAKKSDLQRTENSQKLNDFSDEKINDEKFEPKKVGDSNFSNIDKEFRKPVEINITTKCYCRDSNEVITEKYCTTHEIKIEERQRKLEELLKEIISKQKCVCQKDRSSRLYDEKRRLKNIEKENESHYNSESSDKSLEAIRHRYSDTSDSERRSFKRVSFLDVVSQTEATYKNSSDMKASTISIKTANSDENFEDLEKFNTDDTSRVMAHKTADKVVDHVSNYVTREIDENVKGENQSSEEEFYDTSEGIIEKSEGPFKFPNDDVEWKKNKEYLVQKRKKDGGFDEIQIEDEENSICDESDDTIDSYPEDAHPENAVSVKSVSEDHNKINTIFDDLLKKDSIGKYSGISEKLNLMSRISEETTISNEKKENIESFNHVISTFGARDKNGSHDEENRVKYNKKITYQKMIRTDSKETKDDGKFSKYEIQKSTIESKHSSSLKLDQIESPKNVDEKLKKYTEKTNVGKKIPNEGKSSNSQKLKERLSKSESDLRKTGAISVEQEYNLTETKSKDEDREQKKNREIEKPKRLLLKQQKPKQYSEVLDGARKKSTGNGTVEQQEKDKKDEDIKNVFKSQSEKNQSHVNEENQGKNTEISENNIKPKSEFGRGGNIQSVAPPKPPDGKKTLLTTRTEANIGPSKISDVKIKSTEEKTGQHKDFHGEAKTSAFRHYPSNRGLSQEKCKSSKVSTALPPIKEAENQVNDSSDKKTNVKTKNIHDEKNGIQLVERTKKIMNPTMTNAFKMTNDVLSDRQVRSFEKKSNIDYPHNQRAFDGKKGIIVEEKNCSGDIYHKMSSQKKMNATRNHAVNDSTTFKKLYKGTHHWKLKQTQRENYINEIPLLARHCNCSKMKNEQETEFHSDFKETRIGSYEGRVSGNERRWSFDDRIHAQIQDFRRCQLPDVIRKNVEIITSLTNQDLGRENWNMSGNMVSKAKKTSDGVIVDRCKAFGKRLQQSSGGSKKKLYSDTRTRGTSYSDQIHNNISTLKTAVAFGNRNMKKSSFIEYISEKFIDDVIKGGCKVYRRRYQKPDKNEKNYSPELYDSQYVDMQRKEQDNGIKISIGTKEQMKNNTDSHQSPSTILHENKTDDSDRNMNRSLSKYVKIKAKEKKSRGKVEIAKYASKIRDLYRNKSKARASPKQKQDNDKAEVFDYKEMSRSSSRTTPNTSSINQNINKEGSVSKKNISIQEMKAGSIEGENFSSGAMKLPNFELDVSRNRLKINDVEFNSDGYKTSQRKIILSPNQQANKIYPNEGIANDVLQEIDINLKKDVDNVLKGRTPENNSGGETYISKLARYVDIIEDISLDTALEIEKFLRETLPFSRKQSNVTCDGNTCIKSSRYKLCDSDDAWSSSSLKKPNRYTKSRRQFHKYNNFYNSFSPQNHIRTSTHRTEVRNQKLCEDVNRERGRGMSEMKNVILIEENKTIPRSCFCNKIELRKEWRDPRIGLCPGYTLLPTIENGPIEHNKNAKSSQRVDTTYNISSGGSLNLETVMNKFKRKHIGHGKRITVPSSSTEYNMGQTKITDSVHETLSNVHVSTISLKESNKSSRFVSACNILRNGYGCPTLTNLDGQNETSVEEFSEVCSSKAVESLPRYVCQQNGFEKRDIDPLFSSTHSDMQAKSMLCFRNRKIKDFKGYDNILATKGKCMSEKCVRFQRCEPKNETHSLDLRENYSVTSCGKARYVCEQNANIYICSGSKNFPECNRNISIPQYEYPDSMENYSKENRERHSACKVEPFSSKGNIFAKNNISELNCSLHTDNMSSLVFGVSNYGSIHNFNTEISEVVEEEKTCRLSAQKFRDISEKYGNTESLIRHQRRSQKKKLKKYEKIVPCLSFAPLEIENDFLRRSIFSINISGNFNFDKRSFETLLNILTKSELRILGSRDSTHSNRSMSQKYQFNDQKLAIVQNVTISSKNKDDREVSHNTTYNIPCLEDDEQTPDLVIEEGKNISQESSYVIFQQKEKKRIPMPKLSKKKAEKRRKMFNHYEKQRALMLRKSMKIELNSLAKKRKLLNETPFIDGMFSSEAKKIFTVHKSSSFYSTDFVGSSSTVPVYCEKILSKDIVARVKNMKIPNKSKTESYIISTADHLRNSNVFTCIETKPKNIYHPYGRETSLYPASFDYDVEVNNKVSSTEAHKRKFNCKETTRKIINWFKSLGMTSKHEDSLQKKSNDALWNAEANLMKQRKVLRSKLRYPKTKTSKLYLHKKDYDEMQQDKNEISAMNTIEPVLKKIPSDEIIEPDYEDEDDISNGTDEYGDEVSKTEKEKRMLVFSEDSMVLFDRKKVYDHLQKCGKLFYTIYLNEKDDWDHVSIRSAESVEHRVECEDRPFFATYDLGPNDVRVHVTKDTFEERKRQPIFKNENYVECKNSDVKLSLMRGKRYFTDLDPTKAKIIEIDCTNQFSEIKICYKKTERSAECICEYPQVCKALQLESSELSSLDIDKEDKSLDTQELEMLQNLEQQIELQSSQELEELNRERSNQLQDIQKPDKFPNEQELLCEQCKDCQEKPEICDNYEKCLENNICASKRKVTIFEEESEKIKTVEFCHVSQGFRFSKEDSAGDSGRSESSGNEYSFPIKPRRNDISERLRRRYKKSQKKTNYHNKW